MYSEINYVNCSVFINCSHKAQGILGCLKVLLQICLCCCWRETLSHRVQRIGWVIVLLILITCFFMQTGEKTICNYLKKERAE